MKWISVEDELPGQIGTFLVFLADCKICMAFYNSNGYWCEMWSQQFLSVKHWMVLPASPNSLKDVVANDSATPNTTKDEITCDTCGGAGENILCDECYNELSHGGIS